MAQALLVSVDIPLGREIIDALDAAGLTVNVALWAWLGSHEDWRLVLASRRLDKDRDRIEAYMAVHAAMDAAGISVNRDPIKTVLSMKDPFIRELRRLYAKSGDVEGMRLGGRRFGNRYVEDAYVYRIT